jgi:hypothetical protein
MYDETPRFAEKKAVLLTVVTDFETLANRVAVREPRQRPGLVRHRPISGLQRTLAGSRRWSSHRRRAGFERVVLCAPFETPAPQVPPGPGVPTVWRFRTETKRESALRAEEEGPVSARAVGQSRSPDGSPSSGRTRDGTVPPRARRARRQTEMPSDPQPSGHRADETTRVGAPAWPRGQALGPTGRRPRRLGRRRVRARKANRSHSEHGPDPANRSFPGVEARTRDNSVSARVEPRTSRTSKPPYVAWRRGVYCSRRSPTEARNPAANGPGCGNGVTGISDSIPGLETGRRRGTGVRTCWCRSARGPGPVPRGRSLLGS